MRSTFSNEQYHLEIPMINHPQTFISPVDEKSIVTVTTLAGLAGVKQEWLDIRQRCGTVMPNNDPDRFIATLQTLGPGISPYVSVLRNREGPCAAIISRITQDKSRVFLGFLRLPQLISRSLDVVYGGLIADRDNHARELLLNDLVRNLEKGQVDLITVNHLPISDPLFKQILQHPLLGEMVHVMLIQPHWRFRLVPGSFQDTMNTFKKKRRDELKREGRRLADSFAGQIKVVTLGTLADVDRILKDGSEISSRTYHAHIGTSFSESPLWREHLTLEARRGTLRAFFLFGADKPIAFNVGSVYDSALVLDALAHLPEYGRFSPGKYLLLKVIEHCCAEGLKYVDYGFGDAEYKRVFGTECFDEVILRIYARKWGPRLARFAGRLVTSVTTYARQLARRAGVLTLIKKASRSQFFRL